MSVKENITITIFILAGLAFLVGGIYLLAKQKKSTTENFLITTTTGQTTTTTLPAAQTTTTTLPAQTTTTTLPAAQTTTTTLPAAQTTTTTLPEALRSISTRDTTTTTEPNTNNPNGYKYAYKTPHTNLMQKDFEGTSNVFAPFIYYDQETKEKFTASNGFEDKFCEY